MILTPKKIFFIDSIGALLSAIFLGLILPMFEDELGIPQKVLIVLSLIAIIFSIHSFKCFLSKKETWRYNMKIIAFANFTYCCLTFAVIFHLFHNLTALGLLYFMLEIVLVTYLDLFEMKTVYNSKFT